MEPIQQLSKILLLVRIFDFHVKVWFCIVKNLAVDLLLSTPFIDRSIRGIYLAREKWYPTIQKRYPFS